MSTVQNYSADDVTGCFRELFLASFFVSFPSIPVVNLERRKRNEMSSTHYAPFAIFFLDSFAEFEFVFGLFSSDDDLERSSQSVNTRGNFAGGSTFDLPTDKHSPSDGVPERREYDEDY